MIGISSLDLLAFPHRRADRVVVPVVDARKGEVFYAMYRPVPGGVQQVIAPRAASVDELVGRPAGAQPGRVAAWATVPCATATRSSTASAASSPTSRIPSAGPLVQLAHARALREEWSQPAEIQPLYLRPPDAEINWATRAAGRRP